MINNLVILPPLILIIFSMLSALCQSMGIIFAIIGIALATAATFFICFPPETVLYVFGNFPAKIGIEFAIDKYTSIFLLLISLPVLLVIIYTYGKNLTNNFYALILLCTAGFTGMVLSADLFNIYVFMEITSLTSYALVALSGQRDSSYSALLYLIIGTIGATLYLLGVGFLYSVTGGLNIKDITEILSASTDINPITKLGYSLIILGLLIKIGIAPCHFWIKFVYKNSSNFVAAFFSLVSANVLFYVLIKIFVGYFDQSPISKNIYNIMSLIATFSMLYGSIYACLKKEIKEILAYSSISNYSLALLALSTGGMDSIKTTIIILVSHGLAKAGIFLSLGLPTRICRGLFLLNIFGLPPLLGFYAKWELVKTLWYIAPWQVAAILISSILALYYSLIIIDQTSQAEHQDTKKNKTQKLVVYVFAGLLIFLSVTINFILREVIGVSL